MSDAIPEDAGRRSQADDRRRGREARPRRAPAGGGFGLRIYKPGQGYYTRTGTAIGAGVLIVAGGVFLHGQLGNLALEQSVLLPVQYGVTVGFMLLMAALVYWVVGINHKANDFFIATEGEMKKVSWSSRKDVIRSTKVVIVTTILMAIFLFAADILFMIFFSQIKVLKGSPTLEQLFGTGS